jgi:16S rRNA (guanine(966)-N(2))-methyltransferase RsmD
LSRSSSSAPRILSGRWKGRPLKVPKSARPTSSRAREALFDILQDDVAGSRFLDLFAGSGAVGLEALSRGAARVVFVERDSAALEANLSAFGAHPEEHELLREDARDAAATLSRRGETFDLVFADPPYAVKPAFSRSLAELLAPRGKLVLQSDSGAEPPNVAGLVSGARRAYGRNVFWFFERAASDGPTG